MDKVIEVKNLFKKFRGVTAVDGISFKVTPGSIFGILGPNGAGKTTTIRIILNILEPDSGEVLYDGRTVSSFIHNKSGYLPEERGLYKKSKVKDVITYFAELKGMDKKTASGQCSRWLERLDIEKYAESKIETLSKGNQQKVQFIGSVIHNPEIVVLDEPFTGFDPVNQQIIKDIILEFAGRDKIVILSTHQMDFAEKMCREILLINKGKDVTGGTLAEVKNKFGTPAVRLEYSGDISFIKELPYVSGVDFYQNYAEIDLKRDTDYSDFLKTIAGRISITHYSVVEPTLNKIFIDAVSEKEEK